MNKELTAYFRNRFNTKEFIPLHAPIFIGNEKKYLNECIDSTFVSSVGPFVDKFEVLINKKDKQNLLLNNLISSKKFTKFNHYKNFKEIL